MPLRLVAAVGSLAALQGCGAGAYVVYDGSRQASREVMGQALLETRPGIDTEAGTDCVMDALTWREVIVLGTSDSTRVTHAYRAKLAEVETRDGVAACLDAAQAAG